MSDFIPLKINGFDLKEAYNKLKNAEVIENSEMTLTIPNFKEIEEIELGADNTKESILRLKNGGYCVVNKTFKI